MNKEKIKGNDVILKKVLHEYSASWFITTTKTSSDEYIEHINVLEKVQETKAPNTLKIRLKGRD